MMKAMRPPESKLVGAFYFPSTKSPPAIGHHSKRSESTVKPFCISESLYFCISKANFACFAYFATFATLQNPPSVHFTNLTNLTNCAPRPLKLTQSTQSTPCQQPSPSNRRSHQFVVIIHFPPFLPPSRHIKPRF